MSWSVTFIGHPVNVSNALQAESNRLTGRSKEEFDIVLPHLQALLRENFNTNQEPVVKLTANGHGHSSETSNYSNVNVNLENISGALV